jgi:hypothetical protein
MSSASVNILLLQFTGGYKVGRHNGGVDLWWEGRSGRGIGPRRAILFRM